jgi:Streptomyces sporulation and cell division protein, SsgA
MGSASTEGLDVTLDDVTTEVVLDEGGAGVRGRRTLLRLGWRESDPLAVTISVSVRPNHPAFPQGAWVVLRDFLRYGLEAATGDGDVRIAPSGDEVRFELRGGPRPCRVAVAKTVVSSFLDATESVVAAGEERSDDALDALIARLLASDEGS